MYISSELEEGDESTLLRVWVKDAKLVGDDLMADGIRYRRAARIHSRILRSSYYPGLRNSNRLFLNYPMD